MTEDDTTDADPQLKQLRSVWLSMREEEPSERGVSALMAAAHQQARAMRPKESLWSRALVAVRRPPVLAFASIAILVGGAVVITQRKHADEVHVVAEVATTSVRPQVPTTEAPSPDDLQMQDDLANGPSSAVVAMPAPEAKPEPRSTAKAENQGAATATAPGRAGAKLDEISSSVRGFGGVEATMSTPPTTVPGATAKKPAPYRTPAPSIQGDDRVAPATPTVAPATPTVAQLVKQCETAAAANNCTAVRALMKKIATQAPTQHEEKLAAPAIARCLAP